MREIKFRGISIDTNKMVYGDLLQYRVYPVIFDKDKKQHEVNAKTVGQFTGLRDKNGKEIYKSDIVFAKANGLNYEVKYGEFPCEYSDNYPKNKHFGWYLKSSAGCYEALGDGDYLEVIGNICQNPELKIERI